MSKRLLLLSSSLYKKQPPFQHAFHALQTFLLGVDEMLFIPYASRQWDLYEKETNQALQAINKRVFSIHHAADKKGALIKAKAVYVAGGNTFRLLKTLYDEGLVELLAKRVTSGLPYLGSSAGTNIAAPTIMTTNDMPIVVLPDFKALDLVPFQINPHYIDPVTSEHMGESREQRIGEFHEENDLPVVGLREGTWLMIHSQTVQLGGFHDTVVFRKSEKPRTYYPGEFLEL